MLTKRAQATLNFAKESLEGLKRSDYTQLTNLTLKDKIIDRYTVYGNRVINMGYDVDGHLTGPMYLIFDQIETAGDAIKRLCKHVYNNEIELDDRILSFYSDIVDYVELQFDLLLEFSLHKVQRNSEFEQKIRELFVDVCSESNDTVCISHIYLLFEIISELKSAIFTLHLNKTFKTKAF